MVKDPCAPSLLGPTNRTCLAMEISPAYCDVAILRWQQFAGKPAVLDGKGQTFNDIGAAVTQPAFSASHILMSD